MKYNSQRSSLIMPEYGRNIQQMIDHMITLEDKEERNKMAKAIIKVMIQVNPKTKELDNYEHKLWDHMHIISQYKLDVDSPFPKPDPKVREEKPARIAYPARDIKYRHYGKAIQEMIKKCIDTEEGEAKDAFTLTLANLMKRDYLTWNKNTVNDEVILKHLEDLSGGKLTLKDPSKIISTHDLLRNSGSSNNNNNKKRRNNKSNNRRKRN